MAVARTVEATNEQRLSTTIATINRKGQEFSQLKKRPKLGPDTSTSIQRTSKHFWQQLSYEVVELENQFAEATERRKVKYALFHHVMCTVYLLAGEGVWLIGTPPLRCRVTLGPGLPEQSTVGLEVWWFVAGGLG
jgi:hypothetical protein